MEIYIGKDGLVLGPYYPDEIQMRLDRSVFVGDCSYITIAEAKAFEVSW